jgi:hypothetical protein
MLVPLNTKFKGKIAKHIQVAVVWPFRGVKAKVESRETGWEMI